MELAKFTEEELTQRAIGAKKLVDTVAIFNLKPSGPWLAGGSVRRLFDGCKGEHDYDLFFKDETQLRSFKDSKGFHQPIFESEFAESYEKEVEIGDGENYELVSLKVQLIKFYFPTLSEVLDHFDFTAAQFAFDGFDFYASPLALLDSSRKKLVIHKLSFGVVTLKRIFKYIQQGYTLCSGSAARFLNLVAEHPEVIHEEIKYID